LQVIGRIECEKSASFSGGERQLLYIGQAPTSYFMGADHIELAQAERGSNTPVDIFVQVKPNEECGFSRHRAPQRRDVHRA